MFQHVCVRTCVFVFVCALTCLAFVHVFVCAPVYRYDAKHDATRIKQQVRTRDKQGGGRWTLVRIAFQDE
jgi:hypothetical protein